MQNRSMGKSNEELLFHSCTSQLFVSACHSFDAALKLEDLEAMGHLSLEVSLFIYDIKSLHDRFIFFLDWQNL